jgi:hypothetical protein
MCRQVCGLIMALLSAMISICCFAVLVFGASSASASYIQEAYAAADHCSSNNNKCLDKQQPHNSDFMLSDLSKGDTATKLNHDIQTDKSVDNNNNNNIPLVLPFP